MYYYQLLTSEDAILIISNARSERGKENELVSYPDPYVRNDDHRLQYDIT